LWPLGLHHTTATGLVLISLAEIPYRGFAFFEMASTMLGYKFNALFKAMR